MKVKKQNIDLGFKEKVKDQIDPVFNSDIKGLKEKFRVLGIKLSKKHKDGNIIFKVNGEEVKSWAYTETQGIGRVLLIKLLE